MHVSDKESGHTAKYCADHHDNQQCHKNIHRLHIREEFLRIIHLLQQRTCNTAAKTDHTSCGKIAACGDDTACNTECNDDTGAHIHQNVVKVITGQEIF